MGHFARPFVRLASRRDKLFVGLQIGLEVGEVHEMVAAGQQDAAQRLEHPRLVLAEMVGEDEVERPARFGLVVVVPVRVVPAPAALDLVGGEPEQEEIFLARLLVLPCYGLSNCSATG